ncbi:MAG: S9 family peptidase, partial [Pyrinomonadaceae bacterium]|nr:S9 family peptidase [Pyrinomonadaceae bacterium]
MTQKQTKPYGAWKSPVTSDLIVTDIVGLSEPMFDGEDIYWLESRPSEGGRSVVMRRTPDGTSSDVTPAPFNVRTRVHEYGGGSYVVADGAVYFSNYADQRLYKQRVGEEPQPLTIEAELRYADALVDKSRHRLICVREDHTKSGSEAVNTIVSIDLNSGEARVLVSGKDFYASPRLSHDGKLLAWLEWNHPNMPWDGCELCVCEMDADGAPGETKRIAGGLKESIFQPEWSPDGTLYFVSDRTGWWNLYRLGEDDRTAEPLHEMSAEFGLPQWVFRLSCYAIESADNIICTYNEQGIWRLARLNPQTRELERIENPYTDIEYIQAAQGQVVFCAGSPTEMNALVRLDIKTNQFEVLRDSSAIEIDKEYLSVAEAIEFPAQDGATAHGFFYAPQNLDYTAPETERPPLLVISHGGPTSATRTTLRLVSIQYWTSRGLAVLDMNYGGSTGYGRAYRERLRDTWGIVDVDDCTGGALFLAEQGRADRKRLAIRGGSAGGYTTLAALAFRDVFAAGASHFGVSDAEALTKDTHKFESRYLDGLIGPYPERRDLYVERSPINFTERLSCPMILFQGLEDKVVPPDQAERMFEAVKAKGLPVAYVPFEGEQHGFRRSENIKRALDA